MLQEAYTVENIATGLFLGAAFCIGLVAGYQYSLRQKKSAWQQKRCPEPSS